MKTLKLLSKKYLPIILILFLFESNSYSEDPVDIWNIEEKKKIEENITIKSSKQKDIPQSKIYEMQSQKNNQLEIEQDEKLISKEIQIVGLYDPAESGLDINMWSNSDGDQILNLFKNINKIDLSDDASELLDILLLTNSYYPQKNITKEQFNEIKSNWLIKKSNLQLIEDYLIKNKIVGKNLIPKVLLMMIIYLNLKFIA